VLALQVLPLVVLADGRNVCIADWLMMKLLHDARMAAFSKLHRSIEHKRERQQRAEGGRSQSHC